MKKSSRIVALLLIACTLLACFPLAALAEDTEGSCGVSTYWRLDGDGVLTIYGEGSTDSYTSKGMPWYSHRNSITKVVVEEGVRSIGACSFYEFKNITEIVLPEGLFAIGQYAFYGCSAVKTLTVPSSVYYIGNYAFRKLGATGKVDISFADTDGWYRGGAAMTSEYMADTASVTDDLRRQNYKLNWNKVTETPTTVAEGFCNQKKSTLPWTLDSNGTLTVSGAGMIPESQSNGAPWAKVMGAIVNVVIEEGITRVGRNAFYGAENILSVQLADSIETIGTYAFCGCKNLKEISIPAGVTAIGRYAFRQCKALTSIELGNKDDWSYGDSLIDASALTAEGAVQYFTSTHYKKDWIKENVAALPDAPEEPEVPVKPEDPEDDTVYGFDFEDNTWTSSFDMAGGCTRSIVDDPAGSGEKVLSVNHSASQSVSWFRNKVNYDSVTTGTVTVSTDMYIPSAAFASSGDYVQLQLNKSADHFINLVPQNGTGTTSWGYTRAFPRDKWFKVQYIIDMDALTYDLVIIVDGELYATVYDDRGATALKNVGPQNLRVLVNGGGQTVYFDHVGPVINAGGDTVDNVKVYGYDFVDSGWTADYDMAGGCTRSIVNDPAGSGEKVLSVTHSATQSASWIRNKAKFTTAASGKLTVSVDLYVPSTALSAAGDYIQLMLNSSPNHYFNLVSDAKASPTALETKSFPRDKWFKVMWLFDMDSLKYDVVIVENGCEYATVFSGRGASALKDVGPYNLRVYLGGSSQTIYVDHIGTVTNASGALVTEHEAFDGVSFLRIEGVNTVGEKLSVFGDFTGAANASSLTNIVWEKSEAHDGTYTAVAGANQLEYTPADGGYYLRVKANFGAKSLVSLPLYIREESDSEIWNAYLGADGEKLSASVVYNNEGEEVDVVAKTVVYYGVQVLASYTRSFKAKQGSDAVVFTLDAGNLYKKRVVLTVTAGDDVLCTAELGADMPKAELQSTSNGSSVLVGGELIADFSKNRYMRFRSSTENDHWIGTEHNPVDMGFAYQEDGVAGLTNTKVEFVSAPGVFKIVFTGIKGGLDATQRNELIGFWDAEKQEYSFIYNAEMTADTETWHENSLWAPIREIEPFDYHLERMSILDRVYNNNLNGDLYDYVIYENGDEIIRIPKLPVPRYMIEGNYFCTFYLSPGESVYYPDAKEGGWKSTVLSDTGDTRVEICWSWYDIHSCMANSVPRAGGERTFTAAQSWLFTTTSAEDDVALIDNAVEVEWRDLPHYQLPLFSTNNTFETQFGGTDWQYAWWKSSFDCTMDAEVGHDGAGSVKIEKTTEGEESWYTEGVIGYPYSFDDIAGKTYRVSGYIKTENVVGEAYIANIQFNHGTPNDTKVSKSETVTGTSDWTYVTFTFVGQDGQGVKDHFYLTLNGTGAVWFDDVVIEEIIE